MTPLPDPQWSLANQRFLMASIAQVRTLLEQRLNQPAESSPSPPSSSPPLPPFELPHATPALDQLRQLFQLSPFAVKLLTLCAGAELSHAFATLCAQIHGNPQATHPTFGLALSVFAEADWRALTPDAPLRRWKLIEVAPGAELIHSPLRLDERILHYLMGVPTLDQRQQGIVTVPPSASGALPDSHLLMVDRLCRLLTQPAASFVVQLCGEDSTTKLAIATTAAKTLGLTLHRVTADRLPTDLGQVHLLQCLCEREALLSGSVLLLDCDRIPATVSDGYLAQLNLAVDHWVESSFQPLLIMSCDRRLQRQRPLITFEVQPPTADEQRQIWQTALGETAIHLNGHIDKLVSYFNLSSPAIHATCLQVFQQASPAIPTDPLIASDPHPLAHSLWETCLAQARPRLGDLAQPIEPVATWADLVLPDKEKAVLQTLAAHVRQRATVYDRWGFASKSRRGLGISALFAGVSGTGKTMAAEVLANDLHLDLYRIDLSATVSKYIGETEKNLRRIFDAAETGGAILLFDEADALFGKRSDVKDSHDRYANMEVAYLLQRIEAYRGLAILTTNLKDTVDQAFLRRIRFVVQFPFPDPNQREIIWQRVFPPRTPLQNLNYRKLSKLSVAGGNIRNIALNAAFLAADAEEPVQMKHLLQAAQSEYIKLERPLTDPEVKGWVP